MGDLKGINMVDDEIEALKERVEALADENDQLEKKLNQKKGG